MDRYTHSLASELRQSCGTTDWYKHFTGFLYTDGVKYLADTLNCHWLLVDFGEFLREHSSQDFLSLRFARDSDLIFNVKITDGNENVLGKRQYCMSNLVIDENLPPEMALRIFLVFDQGLNKHVAMIPSEY